MIDIFIIFSHQRSASTTLCKILHKLDNVYCCREIYNNSKSKDKSCIEILNEYLEPLDHSITNFGFKLFIDHLNEDNICKIIEHFKIKKIIISKRDFIDSYKSLKKSLTTGNWGTNPEKQVYNKENNIIKYTNLSVPSYTDYCNKLNKWFSLINSIINKYNLDVLYLDFNLIISQNINNILYDFIFHDKNII